MEKNRDLLLVIDMQNVYLPGQEWACPSMPDVTRKVRALLDAKKAGDTVFTRFVAPENPVGTWKDYNVENAAVNADPWLNAIVDDLQPYAAQYPVLEKSVYSSMKIPELAKRAKAAEHVVLAGVVAECCVLSTMMEAIDQGHSVIFLYDCIAGQSQENEQEIRKLAESFAPLHTLVMSSEEYIRYQIKD